MGARKISYRFVGSLALLIIGEFVLFLGVNYFIYWDCMYPGPDELYVAYDQGFNGTVTQANPIVNLTMMGAILRIEGFQTNGTPVTIHVFSSYEGTLLWLSNQTDLENTTLEIASIFESVVVEVLREDADASFQCQLVGQMYMPAVLTFPLAMGGPYILVGLILMVLGVREVTRLVTRNSQSNP